LMGVTSYGGINALDATVVGLTRTGNPQADRMSISVPIELAQELILTDRISRAAVVVEETDRAPTSALRLARLMPSMDVKLWQELAPLYHQLRQLYLNQFSVFAFILVLLIALPIANMTALSVAERTREIGTMRALGISRQRIRRMFMIEACLASAVGGIAALVLSAIAVPAINGLGIVMPPPPNSTASYPLSINFLPSAGLLAIAVVVLVAVVSAWLSTRRLTRLVDALRAL
jgi:putative ABC transport system permease protein